MHVLFALFTLQSLQLPAPPRGFGTSAAEVVVDSAGVLSAESEERINRLVFDVHRKSGGEIAVVTLPDIGLRAPSDVALAIGRAWGVGARGAIGDSARNAGAVVLVVPKETSSTGRGQCWVSTGRGTEGFILDADAASMCREAIPLFQRQEYGAALELITRRVAEEFAREFGITLDTALAPPIVDRPIAPRVPRSGGINPALLLLLFVFLVIVLNSLGGRGGRGRRGSRGCLPLFIPMGYSGRRSSGGWYGGGGGWGGGGFGGGGGGFGGFGGGGGFSGGGGGSSW